MTLYFMIRSLEEYDELCTENEAFVPIIETGNYYFIGPLSGKGVTGSCLSCFLYSLKDNESEYFDIIENSLKLKNVRLDKEIFPSIVLDILNESEINFFNKVVVVNKRNYSLNELYVHEHPICSYKIRKAYCDAFDDKIYEYNFNPYRRAKNTNVLLQDEKFKKLINGHTGIGTKFYIDSDSKVVPMYYIRSSIAGNTYYSYGRTFKNDKSKLSAMYEMLERYSSMVPHSMSDICGTYNELKCKGYYTVYA